MILRLNEAMSRDAYMDVMEDADFLGWRVPENMEEGDPFMVHAAHGRIFRVGLAANGDYILYPWVGRISILKSQPHADA